MSDLEQRAKEEIDRTFCERLRVVGPMSESKEAMLALHEMGYTLTRSGPYTDHETFPKADVTRFLYIAERDVPDYRTALSNLASKIREQGLEQYCEAELAAAKELLGKEKG